MSLVWRELDGVSARMTLLEMAVLRSCVLDVVLEITPLVGSGAGETGDVLDPFAAWEASLADESVDDEEDSPLVKRLFPNAYPHDAHAGADFKRFTRTEQCEEKVACAARVVDALTAVIAGFGVPDGDPEAFSEAADEEAEVEIHDEEFDVWMKVLTMTRLALAVELGIETNDDAEELEQLTDEDPRAMRASIYGWLGMLQEQLLAARWGMDLEGLG